MNPNSFLLSPSGSSLQLDLTLKEIHPNRDACRLYYEVRSTTGDAERVCVTAVIPASISAAVSLMTPGVEGDVLEKLSTIKLVRGFESIASLPADSNGVKQVEITGADVESLLLPFRQSDRATRRFIARRIYDAYSRSTLNQDQRISETDRQVLGVSFVDIERNAEVLEAEGYLSISARRPGVEILARPTVKLVREVEKYGAPREDAVTERDYLAAVKTYALLSSFWPRLELEYRRYTTASSAVELGSVFRAVSPVVEDIARQLAVAHGSSSTLSTLGPVIGELQTRGVGGVVLASQLNHVLKFTRDLSQHGAALPDSVLRIACENAFELVPQLGALFPA